MPVPAPAQNFLRERCDSLLKDVRHCVLHDGSTPDWPAPFPALLYCFSTIDLLGAVYAGDATSTAPTAQQARDYMRDVVEYSVADSELLQLQFRHKLVHLAQPQPRVRQSGVTYVWGYHHNNAAIHLQRAPLPSGETRFWISIMTLAEHVEQSVFKQGGYLDRLANEPRLQANFQTAYQQITT